MPCKPSMPKAKRLEDPPCLNPILIILLAVVCFIASFARGWYYVGFSAQNDNNCQLALSECTLAGCKPDIKYTGFRGQGTCGAWAQAQKAFACAAIYSVLYLMYLSGCLHGQIRNWPTMNLGKCCINTSVDCRCGKGKNAICGKLLRGKVLGKMDDSTNGILPHGALFVGTPLLMLLGIVLVMGQSHDGLDGIQAKGYGWLFYFMLLLTIASFALCYIMMMFANLNDEIAENKEILENEQAAMEAGQPAYDYGPGIEAPAAGEYAPQGEAYPGMEPAIDYGTEAPPAQGLLPPQGAFTYVVDKNITPEVNTEEQAAALQFSLPADTLVFMDGFEAWEPLSTVPELAMFMQPSGVDGLLDNQW